MASQAQGPVPTRAADTFGTQRRGEQGAWELPQALRPLANSPFSIPQMLFQSVLLMKSIHKLLFHIISCTE